MQTTSLRVYQLIAILIIWAPHLSFGEPALDRASQEALLKTKELLINVNLRNSAIKGNAKAKSADSYVRSLGNAQDTQAIYELAADIMGKLVEISKGDPKKMQEILASSPEEFAKHLSPSQLKKLREIANSISQKRSPPAP